LKKAQVGWVVLEEAGSIGKAYRRHDEIGTPFCITVDFETLEAIESDQATVTVRHRDSLQQERLRIDALLPWLKNQGLVS
jgi:glycyl-tRNA synthetase